MKHTVMFFKFPENFPVSILLDHNPGISTHRHEETELIIVLSGTMRITVDTQTYILHPNDTMIINSFAAHAMTTESSGVICSVLFNFPRVMPYFKRYISTSYVCNSSLYPDQDDRELCRAVARIARQASRSAGNGELMLYSLFYHLIYVLNTKYASQNSEGHTSDPGNPQRIRQVLTYIQNHYREPVTLDDLAKVIHITPQYLSRLFREFTGESVLAYITSVRLNFAYLKLFDTNLSLEDIARDTGFSSVRSFSSAFKQAYGQTPGEYRKSLSIAKEDADAAVSPQTKELLQAEKQLFSFEERESLPTTFSVLNEKHEIYEISLSPADRCYPKTSEKIYFDSPAHARAYKEPRQISLRPFTKTEEILIAQFAHHPDLNLMECLLERNVKVSLVTDIHTDSRHISQLCRTLYEYFPENLHERIAFYFLAGKNLPRDIRAVKELLSEIRSGERHVREKQTIGPCREGMPKILFPLNLDQPLNITQLQKSLLSIEKAGLAPMLLLHWPKQHILKSFDHELAMAQKLKALKEICGDIALDSAMLKNPQGLVTPFFHAAGMIFSGYGDVLFESPQALCVRHGGTYKFLIARNNLPADLNLSASQASGTLMQAAGNPTSAASPEPAAMELHLLSMENGSFEARIFLMSKNHGNLYQILTGFGEDAPLTLMEKDYINSRALPEYEKRRLQVTDSVCHITLSFPSNGMALILLKKLD